MKRSNGTYRVRYKDFTGKRSSKTFHDVTSAKRFEAEAVIIETNLKAGVVSHLPAQPKTMRDLFDYWLVHRANRKRKPKDDESIIRRHLAPTLSTVLIKNVTAEVLDKLDRELRNKNLSAKTISNILTLLGSLLRLALELDWVHKIPKIKKPSTKEFSKGFSYLVTIDEIRRFLNSAKQEDEYIYVLYATALMTGMRLGELAGLTWDHIDFEKHLITVSKSFIGPTKNGEIKYIALQEELKTILIEWKLKNPGSLVFPNKNNKLHSGSAWVFQEKFKKVLDRAGFPKQIVNGKTKYYITFHSLRHSYASHWMMNGGKIEDLQRLLGHKQISQTQRYTHLSPDYIASKKNHLKGFIVENHNNVISLRRK